MQINPVGKYYPDRTRTYSNNAERGVKMVS